MDSLTDSLILAALAFALNARIKSVTVTTATGVPECGTRFQRFVVEPCGHIAIAFSRFGWQCAHGVGLKRNVQGIRPSVPSQLRRLLTCPNSG